MTYQTKQHAIATLQNLESIRRFVSTRVKKIFDIGCNEGILAMSLARSGFDVVGIEANPKFSSIATENAREPLTYGSCSIIPGAIGANNLDVLDTADCICLLSVHHQFVSNLGLEEGNKLLLDIFKKAKLQFFFQPACIHEKYSIKMPFRENDYVSIENYFLDLFSSARSFRYQWIGLTDNRLPPSEPLRPLMLFDFENCDNQRLQGTHSPSEFKARPTDIVHIQLDKCVTNFWFQFGTHGNHPLQKQVHQLLKQKGEMSIHDTVLYKHYQTFQPQTYTEAAETLTRSPLPQPLGQLSTRKYLPIQQRSLVNEQAWKNGLDRTPQMPDWDQNIIGPQTQEKIMSELNRVTGLIQSLAKDGYSPHLFRDGFVRGVYIEMDQDWRFLVTAGMHRLSVMSNLGYAEFAAKIQPGWPPVLDANDLGLPDDLREYLRLFFNKDFLV